MRIIRFFPYFGAKQSRWKYYPEPEYRTIIEPFAGSAAYATHYPDRKVILIEKDERVAAIWDWLIHVPEEEFLRVPTFDGVERVSELGITEPGPLNFLRMWACDSSLGRDKITSVARARDKRQPASSWTPEGRERLARQLRLIRHWEVWHGSWEDVDADGFGNIEATWFIDPPYQEAGKAYKHGSAALNFGRLGEWCRRRRGQAIVCENEGADWLPFRLLRGDGAARVGLGKGSKEVIWAGGVK